MKIFKYLESKLMPRPTVLDYNENMLETARMELAQALNDLDRAKFTVEYRRAQIVRLAGVSEGMPTQELTSA